LTDRIIGNINSSQLKGNF